MLPPDSCWNGLASWSFVDVAAFPKLEHIQKPPIPDPPPDPPEPDPIDDTWVSRPILTDVVSISNGDESSERCADDKCCLVSRRFRKVLPPPPHAPAGSVGSPR